MAKKSLEERVSAIEAQLGGKTLQEHFREQAELIDRLFAFRFRELEDRWDAKLDATLETKLEQKLEALETKLDRTFEIKLQPIRRDVGVMKDTLMLLVKRLP
jgi:hypothetical protein